jgi:chloride channel 3/4/5
VVRLAPYAAGSGISEVKVILGGFVIKRFLGVMTLVVKVVGLVFSVGSGMNVGKEGPFVHLACCCANVVARFFPKYRHNEAKKRELFSCASAAGECMYIYIEYTYPYIHAYT